MFIAASVFAALAAIVHIYIFVMESVLWTKPATRKVFGIASEADAELTKPLAFNQGFYNLFLAITAIIGIIVITVGPNDIGATLIFSGVGAMLAAGLVLLLTSPELASAAIKQLAFPLVTVVLLAIAVAT